MFLQLWGVDDDISSYIFSNLWRRLNAAESSSLARYQKPSSLALLLLQFCQDISGTKLFPEKTCVQHIGLPFPLQCSSKAKWGLALALEVSTYKTWLVYLVNCHITHFIIFSSCSNFNLHDHHRGHVLIAQKRKEDWTVKFHIVKGGLMLWKWETSM